ncbi:MAG TPA: polymer-forming cytoskeletal protein [Alphaproteobacteria bacterium]|nr:polymer-forming cytoskeletal protein [Alphaproteobacteria bacterium]
MSQAPQNNESNESATADRVDIPSSPFQRPGQPAAAASAPAAAPAASASAPNAPRASAPAYSAYPGAYGSMSSGMSGATAASSDPNARRLIIGQGITMSGEIESCDLLIVEGTVEAALKGASGLEIAESGMFYGTVEIDEATIAGKFEGDLTVNGRLTVRATGSITGAITYKELAVEAGATIDGKMSPVGGKGASSEKKSPRGAAVGVGSPANKSAGQAAQTADDDLPILQRAAGR